MITTTSTIQVVIHSSILVPFYYPQQISQEGDRVPFNLEVEMISQFVIDAMGEDDAEPEIRSRNSLVWTVVKFSVGQSPQLPRWHTKCNCYNMRQPLKLSFYLNACEQRDMKCIFSCIRYKFR